MRTFEVTDDGSLELFGSDATLPEGAYTTFRTYHADRVLRLERHVARLVESAALEGLRAELDAARVRRGLADALDRTGFAETRVRLTLAPPRLFAGLEPFAPLPARLYVEGVACATVALQRENPRAKDTRFLATAADALAHLRAGSHEGLMVGPDGAILEGLSSNFFGVLEGALHTEAERVLAGVTRSLVIELAGPLLPVRTEPVRLADLKRLQECFLTSVSRGVLPVVEIDGQSVGDGRPGPVARELMQRLERLVEREAASVRYFR